MAATLSEESIRSRVNLKHDKLEDVKSLSLPGNYHEKISTIGSSLRKFTRLKHLDLSRNSLTSLSGLDHLQLLGKLNLYYNNITSVEELTRLRHNTNLQEIDLRLNPVARDDPDYRLYLIHLLPNLQKLDDRGVRDRERQAALVHFTSSQAAEFSDHRPPLELPDRVGNPRAEYVQSMTRVTALDDDDEEVLDLIARTGGDLSKPRQITGSTARQDHVEEYSLEVLKSLPDASLEGRSLPTDYGQQSAPDQRSLNPPTRVEQDKFRHDPNVELIPNKYPNIPKVATTRSNSPPLSPRFAKQNDSGHQRDQNNGDPNLQYTDEVEAYTKYRGHGYFTPHPGMPEAQAGEQTRRQPHPSMVQPPGGPPSPPGPVYKEEDPSDGVEVYNDPRDTAQPFPVQRLEFDSSLQSQLPVQEAPKPRRAIPPPPASTGLTLPDNVSPIHRDFLLKLLDLVDKYWNGSRSLHKNPKFKSLAVNLLGTYMGQQTGVKTVPSSVHRLLEEETSRLGEENLLLKEREASYWHVTTDDSQLKHSLKQAYDDVEALRSHLQKYIQENKRLEQKIQLLESTPVTSMAASNSLTQTQLDQIEKENGDLRREVETLRIRHKQFGQVQELAGMLQESHKSLVQTNDHLLKEIEETRERHRHEVRQLHWSYDQLKKTISFQSNISTVSPDGTSASGYH